MTKVNNIRFLILLMFSSIGYCQTYEIFRDDFDDNNNGWTEQNIKHFSEVYHIQGEEGKYYVGNFDDKIGREKCAYQRIIIDTEKDFSIETAFTIAKGNDDRQTMGSVLLFGYDPDDKNYYEITLERKDGKYQAFIGDYSYGKWNPYALFYTATIYEKDYKNKIKIKKRGKYIYYYVNNKYITTRLFRGFYGDYIGLGAIAPTLVTYDYLIVKQN